MHNKRRYEESPIIMHCWFGLSVWRFQAGHHPQIQVTTNISCRVNIIVLDMVEYEKRESDHHHIPNTNGLLMTRVPIFHVRKFVVPWHTLIICTQVVVVLLFVSSTQVQVKSPWTRSSWQLLYVVRCGTCMLHGLQPEKHCHLFICLFFLSMIIGLMESFDFSINYNSHIKCNRPLSPFEYPYNHKIIIAFLHRLVSS